MTVDDNEFFREMTLRICGSLDIEQALAQVFEYLRDHVPVDAIGLGYNNLDQEGIDVGRIFVVAKSKRPEVDFIWRGGGDEIVLSNEAVALTRSVPADFPTAFAFNCLEEHPSLRDVFPGIQKDSALFLRLEVGGGLAGVLLISAKGHDRYTEAHTRLLDTVREPFAIAMANARRYREVARMKDLLAEDNRALTADIKRTVGVEVVGADFGLSGVMEQVRQVAPSNSPTLLLGETGTGKEVIAHAIHMASNRSAGPLISMQCGAIPETLLDSELFGYEKGAFTGATERKRGRFERAHRGTLFLDEIGELSPEAQVKLLRILQEHKFERVGGTQTIDADVRVIAATHRDLEQMVRDGSFREDLWYRLSVLPIRIPPLRLRREDIPLLIQYFVERKAREMSLARIPRVPTHDLDRLKRYNWPGNVRELQNIVERALILSSGDGLHFPDLTSPGLDPNRSSTSRPTGRPMTLDQAMAEHIRSVLDQVRWQVAGKGGAAEILQMNPSTLRFRMKKLGIVKNQPFGTFCRGIGATC
ncbi:MAG: sigma 54-interacting transcriptional regulator [Myxococcota bacterium]|nr:sigma 54-interacting transcriptional regulator [Myxococcota bacterium]